MNSKEKLEGNLRSLIGLPLVNGGRASDMVWFSFGNERLTTDGRGKTRKIGEYALHIQCPWRLVWFKGILVGSGDVYQPAEDNGEESHSFNWDLPGVNRYDKTIKVFFASQQSPLLVQTVEVDAIGSLKIGIAHDFLLEVLPSSSANIEQWRLFQPGREGSHLVMKGHILTA